MAPGQEAVEFNKIIRADRDKKRKQDLADKIFSRRSSASTAGVIGGRKVPAGPSASFGRSAITKPTKSSKQAKPANLVTKAQNTAALKRSVSTPHLGESRRNQALDALINGRSVRAQNVGDQVNIRSNGAPRNAGFSIKGNASQVREYVVIAQNFAPGTTAEDISSVFAPEPDVTGLLSCKLLVSSPTVIAELAFDNQESAEEVVNTYNNKKADNRVLYVYHSDAPSQRRDNQRTSRPLGLAARIGSLPVSSDDSMDVDGARPSAQQPYTPPRGPKAQPEVQDGRYGFGNDVYRPRYESRKESGLVSDSMISRQDWARNDGDNRRYRR